MSFSEAKKITLHLKKFEKEIDSMVEAMGVLAKNHFTKSFRDGGFTDESLEKWTPRKKRERGTARAILVKTGRLRRSITSTKKGKWSAVISASLPYAKIHNEGGVIEKDFDRKILSFGSNGKFAKTKTKKQRANVSYQQQSTINAHSIRMPKRKFIGYSGTLNRKIIKSFDSKIKAIFA